MPIDPPKLPEDNPDRGLECETSVEDEFRRPVDQIEAAGWTGDEAATAVFSLALNWLDQRAASEEDEGRIAAARKRQPH